MQTREIYFEQTGDASVLKLRHHALDKPGPGQVLLKQYACGLNFIDIYYRTGLYPCALPSGLGMEAAGEILALADDVTGFAVGDRVAYAGGALGAYADYRIMPADRLLVLPDAISYQQAAAMMLQGLTVQYLFERLYPLKAGDTILFHAAAGGVGLLACQWAKALGVTLIGTVGSDEKAELALKHGCSHVINYKQEDFVARVKQLTQGKGVPVVYDSLGQASFTGSLDCLQARGLMVSFGNATGAVPPFSLSELAARGSLFITRPSLAHYTADRQELVAAADSLFKRVLAGDLQIQIHQRYDLADAAQAHREMEARQTTGSSILLCESGL